MSVGLIKNRAIFTLSFLFAAPFFYMILRLLGVLSRNGLIGAPIVIVTSTAIGTFIHVCDKKKDKSPHKKEIMFTWLLFVVSMVSALFPLTSVNHSKVSENFYEDSKDLIKDRNNLPLCLWKFEKGTPCRLLGPENTLDGVTDSPRNMVIDRFTIWELVALCQTFAFAIILFCELGVVAQRRFTILNVSMTIALGFAFLVAWDVKTGGGISKTELAVTLIFTFFIFIIDAVFWFEMRSEIRARYTEALKSLAVQSRHHMIGSIGLIADFDRICALITVPASPLTPHNGTSELPPASQLRIIARDWVEYVCATRIAWVTDAVGVMAVGILFLCTIGLGIPEAPGSLDYQIAIGFSAGGTAISLMFANFSLVAFRALKHIELYFLEEKDTTLFDFMGFS